MTEESEAPYNLLCSACYTPCPAADAHVVPRWRPEQRRIITAYRCNNCWLSALGELRAVIASGEAELPGSFCDFLVRQGFTDTDVIRAAPAEQQREYLLVIVDAIESGKLTFHP
jgi:hypothetical protein